MSTFPSYKAVDGWRWEEGATLRNHGPFKTREDAEAARGAFDKRAEHCTHLSQSWCDCDWCRTLRGQS